MIPTSIAAVMRSVKPRSVNPVVFFHDKTGGLRRNTFNDSKWPSGSGEGGEVLMAPFLLL
jgi:hypothetical protein